MGDLKVKAMDKKEASSGKERIKIGYARVSSLDDRQKLGLEVQMEALADCDRIFSEKQSGDNNNRPELTKAILLAKNLSKKRQSCFSSHL